MNPRPLFRESLKLNQKKSLWNLYKFFSPHFFAGSGLGAGRPERDAATKSGRRLLGPVPDLRVDDRHQGDKNFNLFLFVDEATVAESFSFSRR